ncbi:MAG: class I SAM-dependent methyltransferase [Patescibacteria group bacterium]
MTNEQTYIKPDQSFEKEEELRIMKGRIKQSLDDVETRKKVTEDFSYTFGQLGLLPGDAEKLCNSVFKLLLNDKSLLDIEKETLRIFEDIKINNNGAEHNLIEILHNKLGDRAKIIAAQVSACFDNTKGKVIDYGAGDGQVTQILHDELGLDIEGVDVRLYKASNITVPIKLFNGGHIDAADGAYEAGLLTNVLHHEKNNEKILAELDRVVKHKLVVLETVPIGETEKYMEQDKDRTFMNDYLYNRLFHSADVPVPGTFETPQKWIERFTQHGWHLVSEKDLGFDQPTIKDRHYLFVFEK